MSDDLDRFEQIVQGQKPAIHPWRPVTDFSFDARREVEGRHPQLILDHLVEDDDADILDYGCGPDAHLVRLLTDEIKRRASHVSVEGYDPQRDSREPRALAAYDLVICREVLEHVTLIDIKRTITKLCALSARLVYVTTRFSSEHDLWRVETRDDLDPSHITLPAKDLLRTLFVLEGFHRRADLETKMDWQQKQRCLVYERN